MGRKTQDKSWNTHANLYALYITEGLSTGAIGKKYGTFPNTIRRALKRHGIATRTKSEAQKNFLDDNDHPMLGRARTDDECMAISDGIQKHWDGLSEAEANEKREDMAERARIKWDWMSKEEQAASIKKMHKANREKAGLGSKNENAIADIFISQGYTVAQRTKEYSPRRAFEIDIAIPSERVAIEWDGAAHYEPIYGDEALRKTIEKDVRKNAALVEHGWKVIRVRDHSTAHSLAYCKRNAQLIANTMRTIKPGEIVHIDAF